MKVTAKQVQKFAEKLEELNSLLQEMIDAKEYVLDNANSAEYPNEERIEKLEGQIYILQSSFDDIENTISNLQDYK